MLRSRKRSRKNSARAKPKTVKVVRTPSGVKKVKVTSERLAKKRLKKKTEPQVIPCLRKR